MRESGKVKKGRQEYEELACDLTLGASEKATQPLPAIKPVRVNLVNRLENILQATTTIPAAVAVQTVLCGGELVC